MQQRSAVGNQTMAFTDRWYVPQTLGYQGSAYSSLLYSDCTVYLSSVFYCKALRALKGCRTGRADEREMSPELRCGLGRTCPLSSPAWWDGWRNCCWPAIRWDGWFIEMSREWRKFTWRKEERNREKEYVNKCPISRLNFHVHIYLSSCQCQRCYCMWMIYLQSQLIAGVSAIHLGAGQAEPPLVAGCAFGQSVADRAKDVLVHRDWFSTWRERRTKRESILRR